MKAVTLDPKRARGLASWVIVNGGYGYLVWLGPINGVEWASNLALFLAWLLFALSLLLAFGAQLIRDGQAGDESDRKRLAAMSGRTMPKVVDRTYDVSVLLALAASGWFVTAAVWTVHILLMDHWHRAGKELREQQEKAAA